jgi:hypothetical protein
MIEAESKYQDAWKDYHRRKWLLIGLFIGWMPYGILVSLFWTKILVLPEKNLIYVIVPYMVVIAIASIRFSFFKCPRCEQYFHSRGPLWIFSYHNTFTSKCLNCGLQSYATDDPGPEQLAAYRSGKSILGQICDSLLMPLMVVTGIIAAYLIVLQALGNTDDNTFQLVWRTFGFVSWGDLIVSFIAILTIRQAKLGGILREAVPLWIRIALPTLFLGCVFGPGLVSLYKGGWTNPAEIKTQASEAFSFLGLAINAALGLMALFTAQKTVQYAAKSKSRS